MIVQALSIPHTNERLGEAVAMQNGEERIWCLVILRHVLLDPNNPAPLFNNQGVMFIGGSTVHSIQPIYLIEILSLVGLH